MVSVGIVLTWWRTEYQRSTTLCLLNPRNGFDGFAGSSASDKVQISTLVYTMGDKAEDILQLFALTNLPDSIICRKQEDSETVDEFITDLYRLAENCEYGNLHDELVRDRIVVGIRDRKLSEKLQLD